MIFIFKKLLIRYQTITIYDFIQIDEFALNIRININEEKEKNDDSRVAACWYINLIYLLIKELMQSRLLN